MNLFLIGFMGCGKTTIGKLLANKCSFSFVDLDEEIERTTNSTISDIFSKLGEEAFRKTEQIVLKQLIPTENIIIATGGGTPCYSDNMAWMNSQGKTIYLESSINELTKRLSTEKENRPLIKHINSEELFNFIQTKLEERETFYKQASISINTNNFAPNQIVDIIYTHYATKKNN